MTPSEKASAVARVESYMLDGNSLNKSCELAQVPKASFKNWKAKILQDGMVRDKRTEASGRKPKFQLSQEETRALRGLTAKHGSFAFAVEVFARMEECSNAVSEMITEVLADAQRRQCQPKFPLALQRLARTSEAEDDMLRGPKAAGNHAVGSTKGMFWEDENGVIKPIGPWRVWQLDDYSANEPYILDTIGGTQRLCRQILAALDVYSSAWLGVHHVGRERDAYRVEDILRFILNLIDGQGTMPEALMLEQGRWKAEAIRGIEMPDMSGRRWGGLHELFHVIHGYTSRHKAALESNFRILQTALRLSGRSIGAYRGEMESGTKSYLKVQDGELDPVRAGFLTRADSSRIHEQAMQYLNARPKFRKAFGGKHLVPDSLLAGDFTPIPLPHNERWRFHPVKRLATVRGNFIECRATEHYEGHFIFRVNGVGKDVHFQPGHRVFIAFDPLNLHLGAAIANADTSTMNRQGWRMGQMLLLNAPVYEMTPQFSMRPRYIETAAQRKALAAVTSDFKAIRPFTKSGLAITHMADGKGRSTEIRRNDPNQNFEPSKMDSETANLGSREASRSPRDLIPAHDRSGSPRRATAPIRNDLPTLNEQDLERQEAELMKEGSSW